MRIGETLLVGRCDMPDDTLTAYDVPSFGPGNLVTERFAIDEVNVFQANGTHIVERGVLLAHDQDPELLPGWQPLAS